MSTQSTIPTATFRLEEIHRKITWHYDQIAILKVEANSHSPVFALPAEILSKIFASYAFESGPTFDLRWTKVMFVCRRWHDIALAEPKLWATIVVSSSMKLASLDLILSRSGVAPLSIRITSSGPEMAPSRLLQHSKRLRELDHNGAPQSIVDFAKALPRYKFPILRSLRLALDDNHWGIPQVLDTMFDGRAPCLTALDLHHVDADWSLIRGLSALSLAWPSGTPMDRLLSMLQASPALTHLKLAGIALGEESSESYPVVSLPLLQSISIAQSSAEACYLVLCHLTIPPCARISVEGWNIYGGDELTGVLVPICQHLRAPSAPPIRCLRFDYTASNPDDGERNFTVSTSTADASTADEDRSLFSITAHPLSDTSLPHIITKILEVLVDLQPGITHLDCRSTSTAPQLTTLKAWKTAISLLPALEIVYIPPNVTAIRVLQALSQLAETPAAGDASPCLREIRITGLSDKEGFNAMPLVLNGLRQLLSFLIARGTPLERLEVSEKSAGLEVDEEGWKSLSQLVGTLVRRNDV